MIILKTHLELFNLTADIALLIFCNTFESVSFHLNMRFIEEIVHTGKVMRNSSQKFGAQQNEIQVTKCILVILVTILFSQTEEELME